MPFTTRTLFFAALLTLGNCQVAPETQQDAAACAPSPDVFAQQIWPTFLVANQCANRSCHAFANGHGTLRLRPPEAAPSVGLALDSWPTAWRQNYLSTIQLVRCDAPLESRLLTVPEGVGNLHPPGPVVLDRASAAAMIQAWVGAAR